MNGDIPPNTMNVVLRSLPDCSVVISLITELTPKFNYDIGNKSIWLFSFIYRNISL